MLHKVFRVLSFALLLSASVSIASALSHTVGKGDSLSKIATTYGVSISALKAANNIANANKIRIGQKLTIPAGGHSVASYTIRRGDSLSSIAAQHGISTKKLATMNGIRNANKIRIGQKLKVPITGSARLGLLSAANRRSLDRIGIRTSKWKHIILHHTATDVGSPARFEKEHRRRGMENGLAYHFLIGNGNGMADGELHICDRWKRQIQGGHMSSAALNEIAIGVCLVGNFEKTKPSKKQLEQLDAVLSYLMENTRVPGSKITTHTIAHKNHTLCPGKYFPFEQIKRKYR